MKDTELSSALHIGNPRTAAAFSNPVRRRIVLMLAVRAYSLAELANSTGQELKRLHYHVTQLCKLGLVKVARTQRRAGRPIKYYRARATTFFVPSAVMPSPHAHALMAELSTSLAQYRQQSDDGVLYGVRDDGIPQIRSIRRLHAEKTPIVDQWRMLSLTRAEALQLAGRITDCLAPYLSRLSAGGPTYLLHVALAPRLENKSGRRRPRGH